MRILIIGGTRFIGPFVVQKLIEKGHEITLYHRGMTGTHLCRDVKCIHADRSSLSSFLADFNAFAPEVVLDMIPVNEREAVDVVKVFRGIAHRVVGISSQDVYRAYGVLIGIEDGQPDAVPLTEEAPLRQVLFPYRKQVNPDHRLYNYDKIPVENAYMSNPDLPGTILRLPMVYGPGDYQHRLYPYLKRMDDARPAIILEEGIANWHWTKGYVEDMANAIVLGTTDPRAAGRVYNVGEQGCLSEAQWVRAIGKATGWDGEITFLPDDMLPDYLKTSIDASQDLVVDTGRLRGELGYKEMISNEEALVRTIDWERRNPPEKLDPMQFDYETEDSLLGINRE